ncbi:MAG TPA: PilZ domain-containing protein [Planctomycetota bacterium]|nr:PilZ domain-containing protein [Planctomycetota bacterium]
MIEPSSPAPRKGRGSLEKPRRARVKVDLWCEVTGSRSHANAHIRNLTLGGCRLLSPCAFPKGEVIDVFISLASHEPELKMKAEIRWLGLNPDEGPFVLGCRFVHHEDSADRIERLLRDVMKKSPQTSVPAVAHRKPGSLGLVFATEELDRLLRPGLSAPLPGSPAAPLGRSARS